MALYYVEALAAAEKYDMEPIPIRIFEPVEDVDFQVFRETRVNYDPESIYKLAEKLVQRWEQRGYTLARPKIEIGRLEPTEEPADDKATIKTGFHQEWGAQMELIKTPWGATRRYTM